MKNTLSLFAFFIIFSLTAQVGIGTTSPHASLDIQSSNEAAPSNTDGILIPKIDDFPSPTPGANQDGMLVFVTGDSTPTKGFYYWNNSGMSWGAVGGATKIDELIDGKSDVNGSSIFLGLNSGANDNSLFNGNVGIGEASLSNNTSGYWNTGIGSYSLFSNISGGDNTAIGVNSLYFNVGGNGNTAIGLYAMYGNTTGSYNTAIGLSSLSFNAIGSNNAAFGDSSLSGNSSGNNNTALGTNSGFQNLGDANVFIGYSAGYYEPGSNKLYIENSDADADNALIYGEFDNNILRTNGELQIGNPLTTGYALPTSDGTVNQILVTDGNGQLSFTAAPSGGATEIDELNDGKSGATGSSLFLGINAGANDDGSNNQNIGIGKNTLGSVITGSNNIAIGSGSLLSNIGDFNIGIGTSSLGANTSGTSNISLGYSSMVSNDSGGSNIAIGTGTLYSSTTGGQNTVIGNSALYASTNSNSNVAIGNTSLRFSTSGTNNVAVGHSSLRNNNTGSRNTAIGYEAGGSGSSSYGVFIGNRAGVNETNDNRLYIENSNSATPLIYGTFNTNEVGINWNSATNLPNTLSVNGNASKSTAGSWLANSDRRLKKNIETITPKEALEKITNMRGVTYQWNDNQTGIDRPTEVQYGFIAQEIMEVFPEKVSEDGQGFYQTAYGDYDALFVQSIKELKNELEDKDKRIKVLEDALQSQELILERINAIEAKLGLND